MAPFLVPDTTSPCIHILSDLHCLFTHLSRYLFYHKPLLAFPEKGQVVYKAMGKCPQNSEYAKSTHEHKGFLSHGLKAKNNLIVVSKTYARSACVEMRDENPQGWSSLIWGRGTQISDMWILSALERWPQGWDQDSSQSFSRAWMMTFLGYGGNGFHHTWKTAWRVHDAFWWASSVGVGGSTPDHPHVFGFAKLKATQRT